MARSTTQRLALYESLRDKVEDSLIAGAPIISYSLDGQLVQREPTSDWLAELDSIIARLRSQSASGGMGARRNLVRFTNG